MKLFNLILLILAGSVLLAGCSKTIDIDSPEFDATVTGSNFRVGEPVVFELSGNPHNISFYSGEDLNNYEFRELREVDLSDGGATLYFRSSKPQGVQEDQLSILASTNFNGDYSSVNSLNAASWTDITDRFTISDAAGFVATDTVDISDLFVDGRPLYIGMKYITRPQQTNGLAKQYFFENFTVSSTAHQLNGLPLTIYNQANAGFRIIDQNAENAPARSAVTATRLTLYGNEYIHPGLPRFDPSNPLLDPNNPIFDPSSPSYDPTAVLQPPYDPNSPYNDPMSEHWAVTRPISLENFVIGKDWARSVKNGIRAGRVETYSYTYNRPGTYNAVFVARNSSIDNTSEVVKQITVTIQP